MTARKSLRLLLILGIGAALPPALTAQSAAQIIERGRAAYDARMESIESYSVTQQVMGFPTTLVYVRTETEDGVVFLPDVDGNPDAEQQAIDGGSFFRADFAVRMSAVGSDNIEGTQCELLEITDFAGLDLNNSVAAVQDGFEPSLMRMCVDTDDYLVHRVQMEGSILDPDRGAQDITMVMTLSEYENVDGLMHPYIIELQTTGLGEAMGGDSEQAEAVAQLAEMRKELERLPEAQRQMVEQMMSSQLEMLETMAEGGVGTITIETMRVEVTKR